MLTPILSTPVPPDPRLRKRTRIARLALIKDRATAETKKPAKKAQRPHWSIT